MQIKNTLFDSLNEGVKNPPACWDAGGKRWELLARLCLRILFSIDEPSCAPIGFLVVSAKIIYANAAGFSARRMDEFTVSHIHPYVRNAGSCRVKENEVSGLQIPLIDGFACFGLFGGCSRNVDSFSAVDILREAGAVESSRSRGAKAIRSSAIGVSRSNDLICSDGSVRFRSHFVRRRVVGAVVGNDGLATGLGVMRNSSGRAVMFDERVRNIRTTRMLPTRRLIRVLTMTFVGGFRNPFRVTMRCVSMRMRGCERNFSMVMPLHSPDRAIVVMRDVILFVPSGGAIAAHGVR